MKELIKTSIRVTLDDAPETLNKKVRNAQLEKVNFILVVGDKEVEANTVNIRTRDNQMRGSKSVPDLIAEIQDHINKKTLNV